MTDPAQEAEFRNRVQRLEGLLRAIETYADPAMRSTALEAVQTLMEFHGTAIGKIIDHIAAGPGGGETIMARLGADDLVSSLLLLYGLHPADFETRVRQAVEKVSPVVKKLGGTVELLSVNEGAVRVRVERGGHGCQSTAGKIKTAIEDFLYERAPELTAIDIEGLAPPAASTGFVPVEQLFGHNGRPKLKTGDEHELHETASAGACAGIE